MEAERVFRRYPEDTRCLVGLGLAAYGAGRNAEALQAFEKAAVKEPGAADIEASLGDVHSSEGRYEEAARHYDAAISKDPAYRVKAARNLVKLHREDDAISLGGRGSMNLDGSDLNLDFYAIWGRVLDVLPTALRWLPIGISERLLKIEMRGRLGDVRCEKKPVPVLVEPLRQLQVRLKEGRN